MRCFFITLLAFLVCAHQTSAQITAVSDPVGFTTTSLLGNSDTYVSVPFTRIPEFIGTIQSVSGSPVNTITVSPNITWTPNEFVYAAGTQPNHYYVLIGGGGSSNPKEGRTYAVTGNGANSLTVDSSADDLSGITANTQVLLIPYWTLATVFPASDANISFTPTAAPLIYKTVIRVPDHTAAGINLPYKDYYFFSNGWRSVVDSSLHGDDPLLPHSYFVVRNANGAPTLPMTSLGAVLIKKWTVPLGTSASQPQDNPASLLRPFDVALNATGLSPANGSFVPNDQLLLFNNAQVGFDKAPGSIYYYDGGAGNSGGWRLLGDSATDRGADVILAGTGFIIRKAQTAIGQTVLWPNTLPVQALAAVSRKVHGGTGAKDIPLPLIGNPGVECREGGANNDYQVVLTFPSAVTYTGADITSGTGSVASILGSGTSSVAVNLTGVTNIQRITVTLFGVNDNTNTNDVAVRMGVLVGDANNNGIVSNTDVVSVKGQVSSPITGSNLRNDVNANGVISNTDVSAVKAKVSTGLP